MKKQTRRETFFNIWITLSLLLIVSMPFLYLVIYRENIKDQTLQIEDPLLFAFFTLMILFMLLLFFFLIINKKLQRLNHPKDIFLFCVHLSLVFFMYFVYGQVLWANIVSTLHPELFKTIDLKFISSIVLSLIFVYRAILYFEPAYKKILELIRPEIRKIKHYKFSKGETHLKTLINLIFSFPTLTTILKTLKSFLLNFIIVAFSIGFFVFFTIIQSDQLQAVTSFNLTASFIFLILEIWLWLGLVQLKTWNKLTN